MPTSAIQRAKSALWFGTLFLLAAALIYVIGYLINEAIRILLVAASPIFIWRFLHCYDDPVWALTLGSIVPFFFYGAAFGFALNAAPSLSRRYALTVMACFVITVLTLWLFLIVGLDFLDRCSCPAGQNCCRGVTGG